MSNPTRKPNRLAKEKSPYLLQHAQNPVDWYPWSDEAFEKAEKEDKPVFLSIGYSTCHWCHVMEKESFEDEEVAQLLNEKFVATKVDREERPDIDSIYMKTCMLITGGGGWPLTIIMTPQKEPFFAGTYFPKNSRGRMIGLLDLLRDTAGLWERKRSKLVATAERVTRYLTDYVRAKHQGEEFTEIVLDEAFIRLLDSLDWTNAGFGSSPKFPSPHNLMFLLRYWKRKGRPQALEMVEKTLQKMRLGGIFDQVGFGFHRYSTDSMWLVPHFEKMLYDQAMMSIAYIETYQATGKKEYKRTAEEVFEYVFKRMTNPEGAFFSAEDADSEGQEGKFYLWTETEIKDSLNGMADLIIKMFNITKEGNYYDESQRDKTGKNILHFKKPLQELALELDTKHEKLPVILENARQKLYEVREKRIHPLKDDKILTDWNGLMIAALAKGAQAFNSIKYVEAAERAINFVLTKQQTADGRLLHRYKDGEAAIGGYLDDFAFLVWGLIELYETTFEMRYLSEALRLQDTMIKHFWDKEDGGFFYTSDDSEKILTRHKDIHDGAIPAGYSIAFLNLIRLARMTGKTDYEEKAAALAKAFSSHQEGIPSQNTMFLTGLDFLFGPSYEIVIVGNLESPETKNMFQAVNTCFIPNKVVLFKKETDPKLENMISFVKSMKTIGGKTTAYICRAFVCEKPMTEVKEVLQHLTEAVFSNLHGSRSSR
jgi:uncharacterized protein YyaL (SSP411 family)